MNHPITNSSPPTPLPAASPFENRREVKDPPRITYLPAGPEQRRLELRTPRSRQLAEQLKQKVGPIPTMSLQNAHYVFEDADDKDVPFAIKFSVWNHTLRQRLPAPSALPAKTGLLKPDPKLATEVLACGDALQGLIDTSCSPHIICRLPFHVSASTPHEAVKYENANFYFFSLTNEYIKRLDTLADYAQAVQVRIDIRVYNRLISELNSKQPLLYRALRTAAGDIEEKAHDLISTFREVDAFVASCLNSATMDVCRVYVENVYNKLVERMVTSKHARSIHEAHAWPAILYGTLARLQSGRLGAAEIKQLYDISLRCKNPGERQEKLVALMSEHSGELASMLTSAAYAVETAGLLAKHKISVLDKLQLPNELADYLKPLLRKSSTKAQAQTINQRLYALERELLLSPVLGDTLLRLMSMSAELMRITDAIGALHASDFGQTSAAAKTADKKHKKKSPSTAGAKSASGQTPASELAVSHATTAPTSALTTVTAVAQTHHPARATATAATATPHKSPEELATAHASAVNAVTSSSRYEFTWTSPHGKLATVLSDFPEAELLTRLRPLWSLATFRDLRSTLAYHITEHHGGRCDVLAMVLEYRTMWEDETARWERVTSRYDGTSLDKVINATRFLICEPKGGAVVSCGPRYSESQLR